MIHWKLASHSLTHHVRENGLFILASSVLIAINYIFWSLLGNDSLKHSVNGDIIIKIIGIGLMFVALIAVIFMFYVNSFLIKQRNQELGLYNMLGLTRNDLRLILIIENFCLYIVSLIIGFVLGVTFVKLAFLVLQRLLDDYRIKETFSPTALLTVTILFGLTFVAILIYDFLLIRQIHPADLWKLSEKGEQEPKSRWLTGIIGVLLLGCGYFIAVTTKPSAGSILRFMVAVILVVMGTYLVFITGSIIFLKFLKSKPNYYYKPNHFISVSGMLYRMKQNGAGLASICLLCTSILVTIIATTSLFVGEQNLVQLWNPYDIITATPQPINKQAKLATEQIAHQSDVKIGSRHQYRMTTPTDGILKDGQFVKNESAKTSHQLGTMTINDYNRVQGTQRKLVGNHLLIYTPDNSYQNKWLTINGKKYPVKVVHHFKMVVNYQHSIFQPVFVITANERLAKQLNPAPWLYLQGFNLSGSNQKQKRFSLVLQQSLRLQNTELSSKVIQQALFKSLFGGFLFVGILISMTMSFATALIIYYKQVSEGIADAKRFKTMQQVGLSQAESKKAIHSQVLLVFMLPIIGAVIHLGFAFPAIKSVLTIFSMYNLKLLVTVSVATIALLVACYLGIYWLTTTVYQRLVNRS
ncbi:FtsX-like permease family protein [Lentilactobacillus kisonensis]|uniref:Efflux ABC transporter, permease protein n=2 Tax=Lentilactobacillus kisonensis TaxID=481722 RepID=H1LHE9_9LACO|nr:ABC transporter permease [Lentilactobacillus kisonensis]EHO50501.1 efflux ABC transporter, permease protein [Lentilactobacillus kisonensis F0435]